MEDAIPFGHYELLSRINVGGMAEILKARDLDRPGGPLLAVKRILPHLTEDPQYVTMFLDESRVLAQLSHPNIIRTFDVGKVGPTPYLALEYVNGHDARMLFHRCRREGQPVAVRVACKIMADVCAGLHFAHEHVDAEGNLLGIVHRDVSLQNVLLSFEGDVKLIDFGIAMSAGNMARTEVGIVKGKFGYMSPEQVKGEPLDRRSDVFAAGICLYELLTGERLFSGENDYAAVDRVRNVRIDPPSRLNRQIPSALESLVMKALAKSPRDRFQTGADMRRALLAFMAESNNTCTAEDLADAMRTVFADEIDNPTNVEGAVLGKRDPLTGLAAFDDLEPVSALTALDRAPDLAAYLPPVQRSQRPPVSNSTRAPATLMQAPRMHTPQQTPEPQLAQPQPVQGIPNRAATLSEPPTSDLHLLDQPSAPVDMDWDEDEPITQHESVHSLPKLAPADLEEDDEPDTQEEDEQDNERTRQVYVGSTFSGVVPKGSGIQGPGAPPDEAIAAPAYATQPYTATPTYASNSSMPPGPPSAATEPPARAEPRASYTVVIAVVATIVAVIAVGLMATRGNQPASIHLSTMPTDAQVRIDDQPIRLDRSPFVIGDLAPDVVHQLDVSSTGYESWSTRITLQPGQVLKLPRVALVPVVVPEPVRAPVAEPVVVEPPPVAHEKPSRVRSQVEPKAATKPATKTTSKAEPKPKLETKPKVEAEPSREPKPEAKPEPVAATDAAGAGILRINSRPWSEVLVDGRAVGNTPQMNLSLAAGTHTVTLVNSQFGYTKTFKIKIKAGEVVTKIVDLN